jgi:hypothetical protein
VNGRSLVWGRNGDRLWVYGRNRAMKVRRSEKLAYEVVRRVLGADVEHVDDNRTRGHYDAVIHYPDGRTAALEVTTIGDLRGIELRSMDHRLPVPAASTRGTSAIRP